MMFARMLNLDYLNNVDENQLDLSENDIAKNINNLSVSMENDCVHLRWSDCINSYWKKSYIVRGENSIPTSVYNGDIVGSYDVKNQYSSTDFIDKDVQENTLYCYRIFTEFSNEPEYYSGFKNIFYIYVGDVEVSDEGGMIPAVRIIQGPSHRFVSDTQIEKWDNSFDGEYSNLKNAPVLSTVATSGNYQDLTGIPQLSTVATSGQYTDLIGTPELSPIATTGSYEDLIDKPTLSTVGQTGSYTDLLNVPSFATVAMTGSYNDLLDKPNIDEIRFSGDYNDLINKPELSTVATSGKYTDLTETPDVYTKQEVDQKINEIPKPTENSSVKRYKADSAGDCFVMATGEGVTFEKSGSDAIITVPEEVTLISAQVRFTSDEIGTGAKCSIKYGDSFNYDDNMCMPSFMVLMNNPGSRAYRCAPFPAGNLNLDNGNKLELTNLPVNQPIMVKLTF